MVVATHTARRNVLWLINFKQFRFGWFGLAARIVAVSIVRWLCSESRVILLSRRRRKRDHCDGEDLWRCRRRRSPTQPHTFHLCSFVYSPVFSARLVVLFLFLQIFGGTIGSVTVPRAARIWWHSGESMPQSVQVVVVSLPAAVIVVAGTRVHLIAKVIRIGVGL